VNVGEGEGEGEDAIAEHLGSIRGDSEGFAATAKVF
jgi:hypothetical protein